MDNQNEINEDVRRQIIVESLVATYNSENVRNIIAELLAAKLGVDDVQMLESMVADQYMAVENSPSVGKPTDARGKVLKAVRLIDCSALF